MLFCARPWPILVARSIVQQTTMEWSPTVAVAACLLEFWNIRLRLAGFVVSDYARWLGSASAIVTEPLIGYVRLRWPAMGLERVAEVFALCGLSLNSKQSINADSSSAWMLRPCHESTIRCVLFS